MVCTYEVDVRAHYLGRYLWPAAPRLRLMPRVCTDLAIVEDDPVWESRGRPAQYALKSACSGRRVLVVIHGYNSHDRSVRPSYATLLTKAREARLSEHYDTVLFLYWPGGWGPGYWIARMRTRPTGERLREVLKLIDGAAAIDIQTHSLGARCALEALQNGDGGVRNLIMAAAAVRDDDCTIGGRYAAAIGALRGRALALYSQRDYVLGRAFRLAEMDRALGWSGPQPDRERPEKLICRDAGSWGAGHGVFRGADEYYHTWRDFLEGKL